MGTSVLREIIDLRNEKTRIFQVMLLDNNKTKQVEIHEENEVDFPRVQEHLQRGGSVFITSKPSQKISPPTPQQKRRATRTVTAFYYDHV
jgi:hypothetical protein